MNSRSQQQVSQNPSPSFTVKAAVWWGFPAKIMNRAPVQCSPKPKDHNEWLVLIASFKLAQAILFVAVGLGARHLLHKDVGDELTKMADHLHFNSEWRLVNFILDKASLVNDPLLRRIGLGAFCYAALGIIEATGLFLEKTWGEYLTLGITASFLPWEIFEIFRRVTPIRTGLLVLNALVFIYLLKLVMGHSRRKFNLPTEPLAKFR
jgi:uncharacterized membrane protein (DUF2068 family)